MTFVELTDVTLRDGLQMESGLVSVDAKLALLEKLLACPLDRLEITSFVNPKWVPQFAEADTFCEKAFQSPLARESHRWMAFVPNDKGLERLLRFAIPWVSCFVAASEAFNQKNINASVTETLVSLKKIIELAHAKGRRVRIYVSTAFGCPYQGAVPVGDVVGLLRKVAALGADEIAVSDTIGVAVPSQVDAILGEFLTFYPAAQTAVHFHNTYGLAIAAAAAAYRLGVRKFDGTTGGIGGCPYAKGATGNVATEELAYVFFRQGAFPRFDFSPTEAVLRYLKGSLGLRLNSHLFEILEKGGSLYVSG